MASKEYELRNIYNKWTLAQKELSHLRKIIADSNVSVDKVMHLENCVAEKDQLIKALEHKVYIITRVCVTCPLSLLLSPHCPFSPQPQQSNTTTIPAFLV